MNETVKRLFPLGRTVITPNAQNHIHPEDVLLCLVRHARGDWGECSHDNGVDNDIAVKNEGRIFSVYYDRNGLQFWIITEANRSSTTILLPQDY